MPLGGFLVLIQSHHIHRAHLLDAQTQTAAGFFFARKLIANIARNCLVGAQHGGLGIDLGQATCLQMFHVGA